MKTKLISWVVPLALFITSIPSVDAADFLGADGVLQQVAERQAKPGETNAPDETKKFLDELNQFGSTATNLAPADAAKRWLEFVDRAGKLHPASRRDYYDSMRTANGPALLAALPPPVAWGSLSNAIAARPPAKGPAELREAVLRFLAAVLNNDQAALNREINFLAGRSKDANSMEASECRNFLDQISEAMLARSDDPDTILQSLERQLNASQSMGRNEIRIPNLVAEVGTNKAEKFLRRALVTPNITVAFEQPNETSRLAQKLALELIDQLKSPQWDLVDSLDAVDLYEAMDKKFAAPTNPAASLSNLPGLTNMPPDLDAATDQFDYQKGGAKLYYLLGLISHNRTRDASAIAKKVGGGRNGEYLFDQAFKSMRRAGFAAAMDNFFHELLTEDPTLPFWEQYVQVAADASQTERLLATVRQAAARDDLSENIKASLHVILFKALLASDNAEEAVKELRGLATTNSVQEDGHGYNPGRAGIMLARLGTLLQKPEWTEEGIGMAKKWLSTSDAKKSDEYDYERIVDTLAEILTDLGRGPEAEAVLADELASAIREDKKQDANNYRDSRAPDMLSQLALLYHRAGRSGDVLHLLQNAPDWGAADLSALLGNSCGVTMSRSLGYLAAKALLESGQKEPAQQITDALLDTDPGSDRGYELLLALQGTNAMPKLDELFARDQFEERPLIWKGHLLREAGHLEEAEKILRQAISIDPSDGDEGRGDRMRVYAELAEVRAARGDQKEADFFREVVKAIRLSEDADEFYAAGLLKRAVVMYEEGLKHFSDAYCIQSRLAIQLSALGMTDAAEEHYRKAFELMPDSFGRVESHCFGCEKAFDGERAQSIAEQTFSKMAEERPDKPQIHYLLGYLRTEQERYNEARTNFQTAVRLDPDYLNAWVKLQEASEQTLMPAKNRDTIVFNILRLDPLHRHAGATFSRVSDLVGLWNAVAAASALQVQTSTNLFTLTASKFTLEKNKKDSAAGDTRREYYESYHERDITPAYAVSQTTLVQLAGEMLTTSMRSEDSPDY